MINKVQGTSASFKGNDFDVEKLEKSKDFINSAKKSTDEFAKGVKESVPGKDPTKFVKFIAKTLRAIGPKLNKAARNTKGLGYLLVGGNVCKETMGTAIYTIQAFTNEDLPKDKRKFIGLYDGGVGVVSTVLQGIVGVATVAWQTPLIEKMIGGEKAKKLTGRGQAVAGLIFAIPLITQNIVIKRIIAPALATPFAGKFKKKMEAAEAAKKQGQNPVQTAGQPTPTNATASGSLDSYLNQNKQKYNTYFK